MSGPEEAGPGGGVARVPEVEWRQLRVEAEGGEVDGAEEDEDEGEQVGEGGEAVVQRVAGGQGVAGPQLVQHEVHPAAPLHVLALLVTVLQLGPDVVEVVEELLGPGAAPVDGDGEEAREDEAEADQHVVEAGVRGGHHVLLTLGVLVRPVQGAARVRA